MAYFYFNRQILLIYLHSKVCLLCKHDSLMHLFSHQEVAKEKYKSLYIYLASPRSSINAKG